MSVWYLAAIGWGLCLTQLGWTARASRLRREAEERNEEYCGMLDRAHERYWKLYHEKVLAPNAHGKGESSK